MDVAHVRWPRLLRYARTRSTREGFAIPPVVALRPAIDIGLQGDRYIREWFTRGARSKLHFNFDLKEGEVEPSLDSKADLVKWIEAYARNRQPMVTWGATSSLLSDTPQDDQVKDLREYQVLDAARFYGIPAPLIGSMVTEWGPAIEQLARLFWRFCLRHHIGRYLAALQLRLLRPGQRFVVDPTALLRGDSDAIARSWLCPSRGTPNVRPSPPVRRFATRPACRSRMPKLRRRTSGRPARTWPCPARPRSRPPALAKRAAPTRVLQILEAPRRLNLMTRIQALARLGIHPKVCEHLAKRAQDGDDQAPPAAADNELLLYGAIVDEGERSFYAEWFDDDSLVSAMSVKARLAEITGDVVLRINSPGG